jgi:hypothetical protein
MIPSFLGMSKEHYPGSRAAWWADDLAATVKHQNH